MHIVVAESQSARSNTDQTATVGGAHPSQRYHSLDNLRAAMLMLGIWMHGVQCYTELNFYAWPFKDTARSHLFDFTINWVHVFRMPIFFVMAGFFFALLTTRRGIAKALANRAQRILLPFLLGWLVLAPVIIATIGYLKHGNWAEGRAFAANGAAYWKYGPLHLWFLEYLLWLYPLMLALDWLARRALGPRGLTAASCGFRWILQCRGRGVFLAVLAGAPMASMGGWLTTPGAFEPNLRILLAHLTFFGFGWVLYFERDKLDRMKHGGWTEIAAGLALTALGYAALIEAVPAVVWKFAGPVATWLSVFGFMAVFLRYLERPVGWIRYLADSSYWLYLIHVPVLIWVQLLIAPLALPALFKGLLALAIALPPMLVSYHFAVRPTWLGALLNGRRYPLRTSTVSEQTTVADAAGPNRVGQPDALT
jgi:glucan biosynthesis protein C